MRRAVLIAICCLASTGALAQDVRVFPRWHWTANQTLVSSCAAPPGIQCTFPSLRPKSGTAGLFDRTGRWSSALRVNPERDGGYVAGPLNYSAGQGPFDGGYGAAWMAFVFVDELPLRTSSLIWWEGGIAASFAITLAPSGRVTLTYGQRDAWRGKITSTRRLGRKAWHHVALVYEPVGNGIVRLLINGVVEASATLPLPGGLDQSPTSPLALGTFAASNAYDLKGMIDEVKLIQFSPASAYLAAVRREHGLYFRERVLSDLIASGRISSSQRDDFREPSFHSTSLLRAHVASFYTRTNQCQPSASCPRPRDPLTPFPGGSAAGYVYPLFGKATIFGPEDADRQGLYNSLYLNLSEPCAGGPGCPEPGRPRVTGYCGSAALTLWAVYKAFGYPTRRYSFIAAPEFSYTDSHAVTSVYVVENEASGRFLLQDPTFNVSGRAGSAYLSVEELAHVPDSTLLDDGGYSFFGSGGDASRWTWAPSYWKYFNGIVDVYSTWQK